MNSPWRGRPIEESLRLFDEMRRGMIEEGKATLRMKQDMQNDNCNMYDLIAYRIKASETNIIFGCRRMYSPHSLDILFVYMLCSSHLILMLVTNGASIRAMILPTALLTLSRI